MHRLYVIAIIVASLAGFFAPAAADQNDPRLDDLFAGLKATGNAREAHEIEQMIWFVWSRSPSAGANLMLRQGTEYMNEGKHEAARGNFDAVVELAPAFAEGWNKRATVRYLMGDYQGSIEDIKRTLALEERHFGALSGLGLIYDALDEKKAALEAYRAALAINPHSPAMENVRNRVRELAKEVEGIEL
jgi:tetratricopeptide (TPR) repeat protein